MVLIEFLLHVIVGNALGGSAHGIRTPSLGWILHREGLCELDRLSFSKGDSMVQILPIYKLERKFSPAREKMSMSEHL
jgi:hypothetical protein